MGRSFANQAPNKESHPIHPIQELPGSALRAREMYGANYNRVVLELAKVPAFAKLIRNDTCDLGNWISNPVASAPLLRPSYDPAIERQLGNIIAQTLDLEEDWWV
jgi:hypothetical protein